MRIIRVYTGDDNLSHFEDVELEFDPNLGGRFPRARDGPARARRRLQHPARRAART